MSFKQKSDVDHLIDILLHDKSDNERYNAAVELGMLHDPKAVPALLEAAMDRASHSIMNPKKWYGVRYVQTAATEALGEIGGPEAIDVLTKLYLYYFGGVQIAAENALKKLGIFDKLEKYHRFSQQCTRQVLMMDQNGITFVFEDPLETSRPLHLEPADYIRIEYSTANIDGFGKVYAYEEKLHGIIYTGIVALEVRKLHLEHAFHGISTLDLPSEPAELTPTQKKAFKDWFRSQYRWYRATRAIEELLR